MLTLLNLCADDADCAECEGIVDDITVDPETGELLEDDAPLGSIAEGELRDTFLSAFMLPRVPLFTS